SLFAARNPPDALELVVAVGLLAGRTERGPFHRHLAVASADVQLDRRDGRLVVETTDAFRPEINWAPGEIRDRLVEDGGGLTELVESESIEDADAACRKMTPSFGTKGVQLTSPHSKPELGQTGLAAHPAVLLRKKDTSALL